MGLFASLRNAVTWAGFDLGRNDGASAQAVVMIDPATGLAVSPTNVTLTGPITVSNEVEIKNDVGNPVPVSGAAAVGAAPTSPPLSISGVDGGGLKRHLLTDTLGSQSIFASARSCVGRQTLSVTTGAVVTLTVPSGAVAAMIQADGNALSITLEGTAPTASIGTRIDDGVIFYADTNLANVKLIARTATTNVQVAYFDKA